jgi:hypothetical protein
MRFILNVTSFVGGSALLVSYGAGGVGRCAWRASKLLTGPTPPRRTVCAPQRLFF